VTYVTFAGGKNHLPQQHLSFVINLFVPNFAGEINKQLVIIKSHYPWNTT